MAVRWIWRRMAVAAAVAGLCGACLAVFRLPDGLDGATRLASAAWSAGLLAAAGMLVAGPAATSAILAGTLSPRRRRAAVCAAVETLLWLPVLAWLVLNEFVYSLTTEVLGSGALLLLRHNTAAVLENAWRWGARYLVAAGATVLACAAGFYLLAARSHRQRQRRRPAFAQAPRRPFRRLWRVARGVAPVGGAVALALLVWQAHTRPGQALLVACRSLPPLRALDLRSVLAGPSLSGPVPESFGPPVIPDAKYAAALNPPRPPRPHVVYLLLESMPARALHCYGHPRPDVTPNLDRLAAEGTRFAHCIAPSSFSSCSVVSLITSLSMLRGGHFDHFAEITFPFMSLPRALKLAGYELALFSSGNESFDNINRFCAPADFDVYFSHDTCSIPKRDCMRMDDAHAVGEFEKWIAGRRDRRPFYCGFYLQSPHFNYEVPEPWASYYQPVPPLFSNGNAILHIPPAVLPLLRNQYDNAVRYADYWVGRIRDALDRAGALDDAVLVATGDHGEAFMEHGLARHGVHTWEEMVHTPLILWIGPAVRAALPKPPPKVVTATVSGLDVAPTVAALAGIAPHPSWQGVNALDPAYSDRDRPVFSMTQYTRWQETVYLDGFKYLYDLTDDIEYLFDLRADPGERQNLTREKPDLAAAMRRLLAGWHTYQLTYYSMPDREVYAGRYEPAPGLIADFHHSAGR